MSDAPPEVSHTIGRREIDVYADLTGDRNPLHMDDEYAATTQFKTVIAHGPIGLQTIFEALTQWIGADVDPVGVRLDVAYRGPVHKDDTVTCRVESVRDHAATVAIELRATNQDGGEVLQAVAVVPRHLAAVARAR